MTKEKYLEIRNTNNVSYELLYDYYTTHCKEPLVKTFEEFTSFISIYIKIIET